MMKKIVLAAMLLVLSMLVLAGCGEKKKVDPYLEVSLREATYGPPPPSKGFKYKIVAPEIVEAKGHLCLIREGNVTEFIAGRSIADKIEGMDKSMITFNVVKLYSPFVHFKCEQVVAGTDTVFMPQAGAIYYPRISPVDKFRSQDHDETSMTNFRWNNSSGLNKMIDQKFAVTAKLALVEEDGNEVWMLVGDRGSLRINDPDDHTEIILRLMLRENLDFEGGITFTQVEEFADRRQNHIAGTVVVDYLTYMGKVFAS